MTQRVLSNSQGLRVSQPGVSVLSASLGQLQFNSDWSALALHQSGDIALAWTTSNELGWSINFIPFGKTFASPPSVWFFQVEGSGALVPIGSAFGFKLHLQDTSLSNQPRDFYVNASVGTTGIDLRGSYNKQTSGWPQPQMTIRYFVFEYNL